MSRSSGAVAAGAVAAGAGAGAVLAWPVESLLKGFAGCLRDERGVAELTVAAYLPGVRRFLARRRGCGVGGVTAAEVSEAVLGEVASRPPAPVRRYGCALRSLLRYCRLAGLVENDLPASALAVSGRRRRPLLPEGIGDEQARALLRACGRRRAAGRRDCAVIVLMLRPGLRAGEVAALTLDGINWRAGLITARGKRGCADQLPLPADAGEALAGYLRRGRPRTAAREVFVRLIPPQIGMSRSAVPAIVRRACTRGGLTPSGAHRLRHTAACDMLRAGTPDRDRAGAPAPLGRQHRRVCPASVVATGGAVTDGPYPQAIDGLTIIDVPSREDALQWAAKIAAACRCAQEVRAIGADPELDAMLRQADSRR